MANDPYAEFTADLGPSSESDPYAEFTHDLPPSKPQMGGSPPIGYVASKVLEMAPWNRVSAAMPKISGSGAEFLGALGVPPKVAAATMLPISMAPELTSAAGAIGELANPSPLTKGITHSPANLSPEYEELYKGAGISKNLPETGGRVARFPNLAGQPSKVPPPFAPAIAPINYPRDPNALLNFARSRMEGLSDRLSPQELSDYKTIIGQLIDTGKVGGGTPMAMASQLRARASELLNNRVEGLSELNKAYAISSKLRNPMQILPDFIQQGIQKYGPWFARAAAVAGGVRSVSGH